MLTRSPELEQWSREAAPAFQAAGASPAAAVDMARIYAYAWVNGLAPRITSIWRDPARQQFLQQEWDAGRGAQYGLRVRPATASKHSLTGFGGVPASSAMDMPTRDDQAAARLAGALGIGSGVQFSTPDPGHFFSLRA